MPQQGNLSLVDRKSTPETLTMVPTASFAAGISAWVGNDDTPVGAAVLTHSTRPLASRKQRTKLTMKVPVVQTETLNGVSVPKVTHENSFSVEFTFAQHSSEAERRDLIAYLAELLASDADFTTEGLQKNRGFY